MKKQLFGKTSRHITKIYNGRALCPDILEALFEQNMTTAGHVHCLYKVVDRTNNFEYWGILNTKNMGYFKTYIGSGSLLRHFIKEKGIQNFEQHLIKFYNTSIESQDAEATVVDEDFLVNKNTYNLLPGGTGTLSTKRKAFHCTKTQNTFYCIPQQLPTILSAFPQMKEGMSPRDIKHSHFLNGTLEKIVKKQKTIACWILDPEGQYTEIQVPTSSLIQFLDLGWQVKSTKLWMHIPNEDVYLRGQNWTQVKAENSNIFNYFNKGFIPGRPPKMEGAKVNHDYKARAAKKEAA
jgi:hypothetical protein